MSIVEHQVSHLSLSNQDPLGSAQEISAEALKIRQIVYEMLTQIPEGRVSTYGELAKQLGDLRAARAVGTILNRNPTPIIVPCHRIVHSDGTLGGYRPGVEKKIMLLNREGIEIENGKVQEFDKVFFDGFVNPLRSRQHDMSENLKALEILRQYQRDLTGKVNVQDLYGYGVGVDGEIKTIAGVDVSYPRCEQNDLMDKELAIGAGVIFDYGTKKVIEEVIVETEIDFPYITTYLSFREAPVIGAVLKKMSVRPTILMIDGNGILHPLGIGIASHFGVEYDIPTIGIAKSLLCGTPEFVPKNTGTAAKIFYNDKHIGYSLKSSTRAKNPVYVSAGHKVSSETALKVVRRFCKTRVPEPTRQAHILATVESRKYR